jgi:hypothetical protein
MNSADQTTLVGTVFAQHAVIESLAHAVDIPSLLAKLTDTETRGDITVEEATLIAVYASSATLVLSDVVDKVGAYFDADYSTYYEKWIAQREALS